MAATRDDGRSSTELRSIKIELGALARMDGSGKFGFGSTQVIASFHGPQEVRIRDELVDRATLEVVHRPLDGIAATPSKALSEAIYTIYSALLSLHSFPRSLLQLNVQSLSPSLITSPSLSQVIPFSARAAAINACTLAILDAASVGMRGVVLAVSVAVVNANKRYYSEDLPLQEEHEETIFVLDPSPEEEARAKSRHVVAWAIGVGLSSLPVKEDVDEEMELDGQKQGEVECECVFVESEGDFDSVTFQKAYFATRESCKMILSTMNQELSARSDKLKIK